MTTAVIEGREAWAQFTVAISGASGLIGSAVADRIERNGGEVRRLVRRAARAHGEISWDPARETIDAAGLEGVEAVINLSGENVAQRWTPAVKQRIRESRVGSTRLLAHTIAGLSNKPRMFFSASAVGVYGNRGDEILDESTPPGDDFLASVCKEWELAAAPASVAGVRLVTLRTGVVLSPRGGALAKLMLPFRLGVGGRLGSGKQWVSWIALADWVDALVFMLRTDSINGPVNMVAINPVTNDEFAHTLGRVLRRPALVPVPRAVMSLLMGEMAENTIMASQRVIPRRLIDAGFQFSFPTLEAALRFELAQREPAPERRGTGGAVAAGRPTR